MEIEIRDEEPKDIEQVRNVLCAAFPSETESKLVDALSANAKAIISLVAVQGEKILGHILFSPVTTTSPGGAAPPSQAKGLGLRPWRFGPMCNHRELDRSSFVKGFVAAPNLATTIASCLGIQSIISALGLKRQVSLACKMNMGWMKNLW